MLIAGYEGANSDYENLGTTYWKATRFQVEAPANITSVEIYGSKGNLSSGSFEVFIREGDPVSGDEIYSEEFDTDVLTAYGSPAWNELVLASGVPVNAAQDYWFGIRPVSGSSSDEVRWSTDNDGTSYDWPGITYYPSNTTNSTRECNFRINGTEEAGLSVSTGAVEEITHEDAEAHGSIVQIGAENADARGFVWDTESHDNPGNVAPGDSDYANFAQVDGDFGTGGFTGTLAPLTASTEYFVRAFAHDEDGYVYGNEVSFNSDDPPPFRFQNLPGITYDPDDTRTIYAERLNDMLERIEALESA